MKGSGFPTNPHMEDRPMIKMVSQADYDTLTGFSDFDDMNTNLTIIEKDILHQTDIQDAESSLVANEKYILSEMAVSANELTVDEQCELYVFLYATYKTTINKCRNHKACINVCQHQADFFCDLMYDKQVESDKIMAMIEFLVDNNR